MVFRIRLILFIFVYVCGYFFYCKRDKVGNMDISIIGFVDLVVELGGSFFLWFLFFLCSVRTVISLKER